MDTDLRLLLIGVTSYDIQGTANEIMGKTIYPDLHSTTEFGHFDLIEAFGGKRVRLTVAPGFMDNRTKKTPQQMKRDIQYELQKTEYEKGFHGVLMVMSYPFRWTDELKDTIRFAVDIVKQSNLQKHGFLVLTNGHNFKTKYPGDFDRNFREYLQRTGESEPELKQFLKMFSSRIFILDTELDDAEWNGFQVERLYNYLQSVQGTFTLYSSALVAMYDVMSTLWQFMKTFYSYTPLPAIWSGVCYYTGLNGAENKTKRKSKRSESFDTLPDCEESNIIEHPKFESKVDVGKFMDQTFSEDQ